MKLMRVRARTSSASGRRASADRRGRLGGRAVSQLGSWSCATSVPPAAASNIDPSSRSRSRSASGRDRSTDHDRVPTRDRRSRSRYIEVLGLDNLHETHRHRRDAAMTARSTALAVESQAGRSSTTRTALLYFLELRPFAPRLGANRKPFDGFVSTVLFRRDSLTGPPGSPNRAQPGDLRSEYNLQTDTDARYFIDISTAGSRPAATSRSAAATSSRARSVVTVNGQVLQRGRDYDIDYDLGRVDAEEDSSGRRTTSTSTTRTRRCSSRRDARCSAARSGSRARQRASAARSCTRATAPRTCARASARSRRAA